jgi:predicted amidohydrolase YtcJ
MADPTTADVIYRGGTIITMVDDRRTVEAIAVADGRIVATGDEADVLTTGGDRTVVVDLEGATMLPGFIDSHGHFMNAPQVVRWANCQGLPAGPITSIADIVHELKAHAEKLQVSAGDWIIGYGYDRATLSDGRELTVDDLDPHFPDNPVLLIHCSNHGAVLNSAGFRLVGYDEHTETPEGGVILRTPGTNEPAGVVMETAFLPIFSNMPQPSERELLDTLDEAQQIYARVGVTTCQEGASHAKDVRFLRTAAAEGRLYLDVVSLPLVLDVPALVREYFPTFTGSLWELPDDVADAFGTYVDHLKLQGVKLLVDGSPQGKTAFWTEPLLTPGPAGEDNWRGQPVIPIETLHRAMAELRAKGIQIFIHANGDAAIDAVIDGVRATGVTASDDHRTVVIHSQCMRPEQLDDYVELGLSPSFFTVHCLYWGEEHLTNLGPERVQHLSPMASAFAKGLRCSNHTDFSVTPMEPMRVMWSSIVRQTRTGRTLGPDERIDVWDALRSQTIEAAWQLFEEDDKGTIEVGKLADLAILDANPLEVDTDALLEIGVLETIKAGTTVYRRDAATAAEAPSSS